MSELTIFRLPIISNGISDIESNGRKVIGNSVYFLGSSILALKS